VARALGLEGDLWTSTLLVCRSLVICPRTRLLAVRWRAANEVLNANRGGDYLDGLFRIHGSAMLSIDARWLTIIVGRGGVSVPAYPIEIINFGHPQFEVHEQVIVELNKLQSDFQFCLPPERHRHWGANLQRQHYVTPYVWD